MNSVRYYRKAKVTVYCIKVDLLCKRSMLLIFWHQQPLVKSSVFHL